MIEKRRGHDLFLTEIDAIQACSHALYTLMQWTKSITISVINFKDGDERAKINLRRLPPC